MTVTNTLNTPLRRAAMALLLSAPACVMAGASSSVVVSGIRLELIDLDLTDQIDPWIVFDSGPNASGESSIWGRVTVDQQFERYDLTAANGFVVSLSDTAAIGSSTVYSTIHGAGDIGDYVMTAGGHVSYSPESSSYYANVAYSPNWIWGPGFTLSPKTLLRASANFAADIQVEVDTDVPSPRPSLHRAEAQFRIELIGPRGTSRRTGSHFLQAGTYSNYPQSDAGSFTSTLQADMLSFPDAPTRGHFMVGASVVGESAIVPEPSSLTLGLAGVLVAGGALRKRSRKG